MPLHILGILVIGGIAGIAVLLHLLGLSRPRRFEDEAAARSAAVSRTTLSKSIEVVPAGCIWSDTAEIGGTSFGKSGGRKSSSIRPRRTSA